MHNGLDMVDYKLRCEDVAIHASKPHKSHGVIKLLFAATRSTKQFTLIIESHLCHGAGYSYKIPSFVLVD